ncbi:MAG TPA: tRNA uridine-5-carboxymethylaminomethyl(34) synthesis GTPase MnmE [Burkholderiales bacterium]|nr:tRNA uridine-5-carboxymethylaminomethyl(34) synthesis GTPase MnmE [Burkholderiales bacterium]
MSDRQTIAAIATGSGRAGIGVVRVSGPELSKFTSSLTGRALEPRQASLRTFRSAAGDAIDTGIALYFPAPHSYTGEDVLELQGHGGPVVLRMLLQRCVELGARLAEPGEFTRRAFLNGKLDLAQAEGVVDLIDAATAQAARCAMRSLQGDFSARIAALSTRLIDLRALIEATLDFPEDEVDSLDRQTIRANLKRLRADLAALLVGARQGSLLRDGLHVVLAGQPNVGKSSLLNRLACDEVAIVTDIPGTTRDVLRQTIDIRGIPVQVTDTAGLRDPKDPVERIGVDRAWNAIADADVVILLIDAAAGFAVVDREILRRAPQGVPRVRVMNKIDLIGRGSSVQTGDSETVVWLSAKTGEGIDLLRNTIAAVAGWKGSTDGVFLARERHLVALRNAERHLAEASERESVIELCAEELRLAHECVCSITGEFTADDLLGEIFGRFCIGK